MSLLTDSPWPGLLVPVSVPSMGQIKLVACVWHKTASEGEAPVLELWGMWSTLSVWLFPNPLWPRLSVSFGVLFYGLNKTV